VSKALRRSVHLIHGEDPYRARLRAAELVASLTSGDERPSDLRTQRSADLGTHLGLSRHDARSTDPSLIDEGVLTFVVAGAVAWPQAMVMVAGGVAGG